MKESGVEFAVESRDGSSVEGSGEDYEVAFGFDSGKKSSVGDSRVDYGVDSGEDSSVLASGEDSGADSKVGVEHAYFSLFFYVFPNPLPKIMFWESCADLGPKMRFLIDFGSLSHHPALNAKRGGGNAALPR